MIAGRRWRPDMRLALVLAAVAASPGLGVAQEAGAEAEANEGAAAAVQESGPGDDRSALTDPKEAELDARAAEVAGQLRCLVCRNQSVLESNAELSREMQSVIRERLAAGETEEEVKAYFVSRYGEFILLQPRARGINLLVYALPGAALLLGFFVARNRLRRWARAGMDGAAVADEESLAVDDEEWLREALREE